MAMTDGQLGQLEELVREAHYNDELSEEYFYKNFIIIAYKWALRDNAEQAKRLVGCLSEEYISQILPVQMAQTEQFMNMVHDLSRYLEPRIEVEEEDVEVERVLLQKPKDSSVN